MAKADDSRRRKPGTDAPGMKRTSLYISEAAAAAFDEAVGQVLAALAPGTPRHLAASALIAAAAKQADAVTRDLIQAQAAELTQRLAALQAQQEK